MFVNKDLCDRVLIFDTTLRDGEQTPGVRFTRQEKVEIARQLDTLGVDIIEAGFAASSDGDRDAIRAVVDVVRRPVIASLARSVFSDIDAAWDAVKGAEYPRIHLFIPSSDVQITHQLRKNPEEVIQLACETVAYAKRYCDDIEFSAMDASRTDASFLHEMLSAVLSAGATTINIPDTVGYATPDDVCLCIRQIRKSVAGIDDVVLSIHCHNDLGQAVSNSLAAVEEGVRQVEGCINGIGERAGNAALEEVIMALQVREDQYGVSTGIRTQELCRTSHLVSDIAGCPVQPNKAIVGANAFRHASGIHQDGVDKEPTTFEIIDPSVVGWSGQSIVLSKLSGRAGLRVRLKQLGYDLDDDALDQVFVLFKGLAGRKSVMTDADLVALMSSQRREADVCVQYALDHLWVSNEDLAVFNNDYLEYRAMVSLTEGEGSFSAGATSGVGFVDAVYRAIDKIVTVPVTLEDYQLTSVTGETDALGDVTVRVRFGDRIFTGRGSDVDIVKASAKAYVNALNRCIAEGDVSPPLEGDTV